MAGAGPDNPKLQPRVLIPSALFLVVLFAALWMRRPAPSQGGEAVSDTVLDVQVIKVHGETMGTTWNATVVGPQPPRETADAIQAALDAVNGSMSTWLPDSELSQLNAAPAGQAMPVSPELLFVLELSGRVSVESSGAFDVTVGPLVDLWGFGPAEAPSEPDPEALQAARDRVGFPGLVLGVGTVTKGRDDLHVDLSAVAKGYGVDRVVEVLAARGHSGAFVEVGGEVRVLGVKDDGSVWRAGIERPDGSAAVQEIVLLGEGPGAWPALATSGDYRRYREIDGQRVSHTIDPRTGRPITHGLASVSVLAATCAEADAWATALNVLGPVDGMALAEARGMPVLMITRQGDGFETVKSTHWPTPGLADPPGGAKEDPLQEAP
ncbi:MAG: FAD:protein FMN transferase [Alphaproteobacteria bacterium]|nr:FAD:protein FMN transferase [Alphaproteobacteria bacterium]